MTNQIDEAMASKAAVARGCGDALGMPRGAFVASISLGKLPAAAWEIPLDATKGALHNCAYRDERGRRQTPLTEPLAHSSHLAARHAP